jgi:hypothetical protein
LPPTHHTRNHCKVLGGTMLGYTVDDLDEMIRAVVLSKKSVPSTQLRIHAGLDKADEFLKGLWAEGYFD